MGQAISQIGSWVQTTALMWLTWQLTHRSQWPALIATAQILPTFLLGAWGGDLADRVSKRALIFGTQAALLFLALLLGGLVLLEQADHVSPWHLLAIALAAGLVNALDLPARLSFVMDMVGRDDLVNAVALNSLLFNGARVVGPAIGGLLLTHLGAAHCFLINGLSFVAVLIALALMDVNGTSPTPPRPGLRALLDGWRYVIQRPTLACLMAMTGLISLFGWPFLALLPAFAHHAAGGSAGEVGLDPGPTDGAGYSQLLVGTGCGALLAAFTLAAQSSVRWRRPFLVGAVLAAAGGLAWLALAGALMPAMAACAVAGFGLVLFNATSQSMVQLEQHRPESRPHHGHLVDHHLRRAAAGEPARRQGRRYLGRGPGAGGGRDGVRGVGGSGGGDPGGVDADTRRQYRQALRLCNSPVMATPALSMLAIALTTSAQLMSRVTSLSW